MSVLEMRARLEHHIDRLPVLPTVVARLMVLDREDDSFFDEVLELLEADPPFAARILTAANGAASSPRDPVASVKGALVRLGSQGAARAIMDAAVSKVFIPRTEWEKSLWLHALHIGGAMRALAAEDATGTLDPDVAYAAGLLHDVGRIVMFQAAPEVLHQVDEGTVDAPQSLVEVELGICGITHADLGARACRSWGLPDVLVEAVRRHHQPPSEPRDEVDQMVAMVGFADLALFPAAFPDAPARDDESIEQLLIPRLPAPLAHLGVVDLRRLIDETVASATATGAALGFA